MDGQVEGDRHAGGLPGPWSSFLLSCCEAQFVTYNNTTRLLFLDWGGVMVGAFETGPLWKGQCWWKG